MSWDRAHIDHAAVQATRWERHQAARALLARIHDDRLSQDERAAAHELAEALFGSVPAIRAEVARADAQRAISSAGFTVAVCAAMVKVAQKRLDALAAVTS